MIDRRPELIIRCANESDVRRSLDVARRHDLRIAVRGGGHNVAGNSVVEGGLVIDLSLMRRVEVDAQRRRARVQGGATWGDFDVATQAHGLATPGGIVSSTGVAGLTLGGGIGVLRGLHGLACDNLVGADLITATGERVRASADENPELLWGLRGGGGNFGVVTAFEFALHPLGSVVSGLVDFVHSRDFMKFYDEFADSAPDELACDLIVHRSPDGDAVDSVFACFSGPDEAASRVFEPLRSRPDLLQDGLATRSYVDSQRMLDASLPWGVRNYWKTNGMGPLSPAAIEAWDEVFSSAKSPMSQVQVEHLHGALHRTPPGTNAVSFAGAKYNLLVNAKWTDATRDTENIEWARDGFARLQPFMGGGAYSNYQMQEPQERVRQAYGEDVYARLVALKDRFDPMNVFRLNQNIEPSKPVQ
ncbi:MAG TPA: FAD-binding oxidoreductase [Candidatus Dormibacteraeota bacterium]|nr:FAD-binding oxidoreductase [Candidatus Dormibacteraeota bacterium]